MDYFQTIKQGIDKVDSFTDAKLNSVFHSKAAQALLYLLIILYATKFAPALPRPVLNLVDNEFFKIFVFFMVIWSAKHSPTTSLLIAVAFLMIINYVNNTKMFEKMEGELKEEVLKTELASLSPSPVPEMASGEVVLPPVVVEPTIVQTTDGTSMVVTPQVIIASKDVTTPSGETVVVTPEITQLASPMQQMMMAAPPAPAQEQMPPAQEQMPPAQEQIFMMPPAPAQEQAPVELPPVVQEMQSAPAPAPVQPYSDYCFAMQSYDMSKVTGVESNSGFASV